MKYARISFLFLTLLFVGAFKVHAMTDSGAFSLSSPGFIDRGWIPKTYACEKDGDNRSPKFQWSNPPPNTKSFALICHDPDAPGGFFVHWIIYNIPSQVDQLNEGIERQQLSNGALQGINSFHHLGYDGPCPPEGPPHHYQFTLYALDTILNLKPGANYEALEKTMTGHILGKAQLIGLFQK